METRSSSFLEIPWRWMLTKSETLQSIMSQSSLSIHDRLYGTSHSLAQSVSEVLCRHYVRILTMFSYATPKASPQLGPPSLIYFFTKNNIWLSNSQRNATNPHRMVLWYPGVLSKTHPTVASWLAMVQRCSYGPLGKVEGMIGRSMWYRTIRTPQIHLDSSLIIAICMVTRSPTNDGLTEWSTRIPRWMPDIVDSGLRTFLPGSVKRAEAIII